jgi:hypothetical protein
MLIKRTSMISGKIHEMELPVTRGDIAFYKAGALLQDAFPMLTASQREFIKTGITAAEWDAAFPPED